MNQQLIEAVTNLLSIDPDAVRLDQCSQCECDVTGRWGAVGGEPVCEGCIRKHAILVLEHANVAQGGH